MFDYGGVDGCTSVTATNYNVNATNDDGSCTYDSNTVPGCTDPAATNSHADADSDDGSCVLPLDGSNVEAIPRDINELPDTRGDPRTLDKL